MHRPAHSLLASTLGCALTSALVVAGALAAPTQAAGPAIPVNCSETKVVLRWDDLTYDLQGTCGVVVIAADDTEVTIPAARRIVVRGEGNVVHAKPADRLWVLGHDQQVDVVSVRALRVSSPRSVVDVEGLVEEASVAARRARLTADRISEVVVDGRGHRVTARFGYFARVPGSRNDLAFRRLEQLRVGGDDNTARVARGTTRVRDAGDGNRIRVHRRV